MKRRNGNGRGTFKKDLERKRKANEGKLKRSQGIHEKHKKLIPDAFPPLDKIDMIQHRYLPKLEYLPDDISKEALAVYPVLCAEADFEDESKWFYIPKDNLTTRCGMSIRTVNKGIGDLMSYSFEGRPLLETRREGRSHYFMYRIGFTHKETMEAQRGQFFIFHRCIIDGQIWAALPTRAKAMYMGMRSIAEFDPHLYFEEEEIMEEFEIAAEISWDIHSEFYRHRKWDVCMVSQAKLCKMVNISQYHLSETMDILYCYDLVIPINQGMYYVYLRPVGYLEDQPWQKSAVLDSSRGDKQEVRKSIKYRSNGV